LIEDDPPKTFPRIASILRPFMFGSGSV